MMNQDPTPELTVARRQTEVSDAALGQAIGSEDYEAAGELIAQFGETISSRLREGSEAGQTKRLLTDATAALQQARRMVLANRAHLQSRLNQLSRASRYGLRADESKSRTWLMKG